jgi:undecaprenyl-diphosphatase
MTSQRDRLVADIARFDEWADEQLEHLRGNRVADFVFTNASHLGDFSVLWQLVALARGVTGKERERQALILSLLLGAESLLVNQGVKRLFQRVRPTESGDDRYDMRTPMTSSFPSGHASAAFFAATILTEWSGRRSAPLWFGLAGIVATSRAYVRIHHASDVVGGAVVGLALGAIAKRGLRALA